MSFVKMRPEEFGNLRRLVEGYIQNDGSEPLEWIASRLPHSYQSGKCPADSLTRGPPVQNEICILLFYATEVILI
jgi:hypothetical protein